MTSVPDMKHATCIENIEIGKLPSFIAVLSTVARPSMSHNTPTRPTASPTSLRQYCTRRCHDALAGMIWNDLPSRLASQERRSGPQRNPATDNEFNVVIYHESRFLADHINGRTIRTVLMVLRPYVVCNVVYYFLDNCMASEKRLQCWPVLRYKDALKVNLKQCGIDPSALGDDTEDCSAWRTLCHEAVTQFEDSRVEALSSGT